MSTSRPRSNSAPTSASTRKRRPGRIKKVLLWSAAVVILLAIIGSLLPDDTDTTGAPATTAAAVAQLPGATTDSTTPAAPSPSPAPTPSPTPTWSGPSYGTAAVVCQSYGETIYPYGFDEHEFLGVIADEEQSDGSRYVKMTVTVTNAFGAEMDATMECTVAGADDVTLAQVTEFNVY